MADIERVQANLNYLRVVVNRREASRGGHEAIYVVWAVYTLIGYTLIDLRPPASSIFFAVAAVPAGLLSAWIGRRVSRQAGDYDQDLERRRGLHWGGGVGLILISCVVMQTLYPPTRALIGGQICVELFGLLYFLAGVHFDRHFLWLGPLLMAGGLAVGRVPFYPWTSLGVVLSVGLCIPYVVRRWRNG